MLIRIILILLSLSSFTSQAKVELNYGDTPPNFLGRDKNGNDVTLEDHKGKLVIISFWASWCPPCLKELPVLESIQQHLGTDKIKVVAINHKEDRRVYRKLRRTLSALHLTLTHDRLGSIGKKFGVKGIPSLFIVGKSGKLVYRATGYGDSTIDQLSAVINQQLSEAE